MNMESKVNIQEIMLRYLNGEASSAEADYLQQWISESAENKAEFETVSLLWKDTGIAALQSFDADGAWKKISPQMERKEARIVFLSPWKKRIAVAASIIVIIAAFYFYNQSSKITWTETLAQTANKTIQISDGSVIVLRKGSKLLLPDNFGNESRTVKLEGEAYFQIKHDDQNPFSISTGKSFIQDIGTSFLVQSNDSIEQVTVMEGEVRFSSRKKEGRELKLKAGESAVLEKETLERRIIETTNLLSWKTDKLVFNNTSLAQVVNDLQSYYSINVHLPANLSTIQVTAEFSNEPISKVIDELRLFTGLNFQWKGNELYVTK